MLTRHEQARRHSVQRHEAGAQSAVRVQGDRLRAYARPGIPERDDQRLVASRRRRARGSRLGALLERDPGNRDVAVEERLARHAMTRGEVRFGEVLALLVLHAVRVLDALLDPAAASAADAAATLEGDAALL